MPRSSTKCPQCHATCSPNDHGCSRCGLKDFERGHAISVVDGFVLIGVVATVVYILAGG